MEQLERQSMNVDIVCVGFGPATGGFLTTLARDLMNSDGTPKLESRVTPGMPLEIVCYERADDIGFGVSGVVSKARAIRKSFPKLDPSEIPMAAEVKREKLVYLLDPIGASRRSGLFRFSDGLIRALKWILPYREHALEIPFIPPFLQKHGGLVFSIGQFNQWVGSQLMASGHVQIWPSMPVAEPLVKGGDVIGVRLIDQGTDRSGKPAAGFMPGMDVHAPLTVVGDGPAGAIGRKLDDAFGLPEGAAKDEWAVGMKMVVDLPEGCGLEPGAVFHTFGYPEPEIFGFLYVYPGHVVSLGIFVPSWFENPVRCAYRYLQHWMMHPYLWRYLKGGRLRSWGAKSLQESGKRGEPWLVGNGYARVGEGSGSTNVLSGSGVDEAWMTGVLLAEAVEELVREKKSFTKENLEATYVRRRRASWLEKEARIAKKSRDGFQRGVIPGLIGMTFAWLTRGMVSIGGGGHKGVARPEDYFAGKISAAEIGKIREEARRKGTSLHDLVMKQLGWPEVSYDGQLLVSHQDALLMGGKVQAAGGYRDHVAFLYPHLCEHCDNKVCIELCSGQAITPGEKGVPLFDREKCVHCGACIWNCIPGKSGKTNIDFQAGSGGLHSAEN